MYQVFRKMYMYDRDVLRNLLKDCYCRPFLNNSHIPCLFFTVVDCGRLSDPTNGDVSLRTTTFNSRAAYSCNNGFLLVGQTTRVCQSNGEWSGKAPVCKSERLVVVYMLMSTYVVLKVHNN